MDRCWSAEDFMDRVPMPLLRADAARPRAAGRASAVDVELHGHIIDSLLLSKVLDQILSHGGSFVVQELRVGYRLTDPSYARISVWADNSRRLQEILAAIRDHGAAPADLSHRETINRRG
jgi:hypothetical protein